MLGMKPTPNVVEYVSNLLKKFVCDLNSLYGSSHMTYSVHGLLHVPDDYERYGVLDRVSAFPFENYMQKLGSYVGRGGQELQQVVARRHEESFLEISSENQNRETVMRREHSNGPLGRFESCAVDTQYEEIIFRGKRFCVTSRNNVVFVNKKFGRIVNFCRIGSKLYTLVRFFEATQDFFVYPCPSQKVGIAKCTSALFEDIVAVDLRLAEKCVAFPIDVESVYVARLLHETVK
jgi:hypothetical protein